jgi:hypothetical protein
MTQYTLTEFNAIMFGKFDYILPNDVNNIILKLKEEVQSYIGSTQTEVAATYEKPVKKSGSHYQHKKSGRIHTKQVTDEDWEAVRNPVPFKATVIDKKEGIEKSINDIRVCLNKISSKNYQSQFQSQLGFNPYVSSGFIPNFAQISPSVQTSISKALANGDLRTLSNLETNAATAGKLTTADKVAIQEARASISASRGKKTAKTVIPYNATQLGLVGVQGTSGPLNATSSFATLGFPNDPRFVRFEGIQGRTLDDLRNSQLRYKEYL